MSLVDNSTCACVTTKLRPGVNDVPPNVGSLFSCGTSNNRLFFEHKSYELLCLTCMYCTQTIQRKIFVNSSGPGLR